MKRLKSTSKGGQSLKARAADSKGARKKELNKLSSVDKRNFANAPEYIQNKIRESYVKGRKKKAHTKNHGKFI